MSRASAAKSEDASVAERLKGTRILLVGPSLRIMGGQAVQLDLLLRNLRAEGVDVDFLPVNPVPWGPLEYLTRVKYLRTLVVSIFYLAALLWRVRKHDLIHIFSASYFSFILAPTPALLVARLYGKRTILNYRSGEAEEHLQRSGRFVHNMLKRADKIVVPSAYLVEVFGRFGYKAQAVYNLSDPNQFVYRERVPLRPRIIVARNLEPLYDVGAAIRAFAEIKREHPQATLTVIGEGREAGKLRLLVKELGLADVTFTGRVERARMPELYNEADIFLNSSIIDNMPVAIVEAFHAGLPVVTTNAGGIPYIVKHEVNGLLVEMRDYRGLAAAANRLLADPELSRRLIAEGRSWAEQCSWPQVRGRWAEIYRSVVS
ncbi:MAG: glycosyltransferase family 4 protein [bacterium]